MCGATYGEAESFENPKGREQSTEEELCTGDFDGELTVVGWRTDGRNVVFAISHELTPWKVIHVQLDITSRPFNLRFEDLAPKKSTTKPSTTTKTITYLSFKLLPTNLCRLSALFHLIRSKQHIPLPEHLPLFLHPNFTPFNR